jgi:hypothetical protein
MHREFGARGSTALVSWPSAERQSRTEREPGPRAHYGKFPSICRVAPWVRLFARGRSLGRDTRARARARYARWLALRAKRREFVSRCQTAQYCSFPRRVVAPGFSPSFRVHPKRGGRSADRRTISVVAFARRDWSALVRRGASHDAGRSPLGAPPWRFSAGGRASISGIASGSVQRAPRSQVVMPGGRCPGQPEQRSITAGDGR